MMTSCSATNVPDIPESEIIGESPRCARMAQVFQLIRNGSVARGSRDMIRVVVGAVRRMNNSAFGIGAP
jgi:hypothetical protein